MNKIMIIGCCGAGKSTLARQLQEQTNLEVVHLDQYYWKANWVEPSKEEWEATVKKLVQKKSWIMDGNYGGTMDIRLAAADAIIFLKYPTTTCLQRVLLRSWKFHGQVRPDMPKGCKERFNLPFLWYVLRFNSLRLPPLQQKLANVPASIPVFHISSDQEKESFLKNWGRTSAY